MRRLLLAAVATVLLSLCRIGYVQAQSDAWAQVLRATNYAATTKASFRVGCRQSSPPASTPQYRVLCPKLDAIPGQVIEAAALPYLKRHLSEATAHQAIAFWSSSRGAGISRKIVAEIESGVHNQLTEEDLRLLDAANRSEYGLALSSFARDREGSVAVARALLAYEP